MFIEKCVCRNVNMNIIHKHGHIKKNAMGLHKEIKGEHPKTPLISIKG